ncbi:MAG: metallophosphoesterase [Chitinophagaceae bacterium]|nr:metallophosphoesterase [Chitinophagaceae bacterium]
MKLKEKLKNEKTEWKSPAKMFVLSDIEGNFKSFRTLLQANGVIDSAFHWSFGEGHLVLSGDFVDRGTQVMEVLWLIYSLEDQAKAAGGYVHYILGNHEIMNLDGDIRYVHGKYLEAASLLGQSYVNLLGENAELGRWLRTKNIIERIGNMLFVHGGISEAINNMNTTAGLLNEWSRPFYADSTFAFPSPQLDTIFGDLGPFWYRGFATWGRKPPWAR